MTPTAQDWYQWHEAYDDPASDLAQRLAAVQRHVAVALDRAPPGAVRVVSICAGQGRDLIGATAGHPRRGDVRARLVELDRRNVDAAATAASRAGLEDVDVVCDDASTTSAYQGAVPADLVLVCGVFGHASADDIRTTIGLLPTLCAPGATVIWTRGGFEPDLRPAIRAWFGDEGFEEVGFDEGAGGGWGVGVNRLVVAPRPFQPGIRLFTFVDRLGSAATGPSNADSRR